ncbi:MAG: hypothetical protein ACRBCT_01620 [Alphaproteobacteria bacterium]
MRNSLLFLSFLSLITLSGCGIKPSSLEPPEGSAPRPFPRDYPAPIKEKAKQTGQEQS